MARRTCSLDYCEKSFFFSFFVSLFPLFPFVSVCPGYKGLRLEDTCDARVSWGVLLLERNLKTISTLERQVFGER